jgi:hypothetical protein
MRTHDSPLDLLDAELDLFSPAGRDLPQPSQLLLVVSFALVGAGLLVLGAVLLAVYLTFHDPMSNRYVTDFSKQIATHPLVLSPDLRSLQIGGGAARLLALLLFIVFSAIGVSIGQVLIRDGAHLVPAHVHGPMAPLQERLEAVVPRIRR